MLRGPGRRQRRCACGEAAADCGGAALDWLVIHEGGHCPTKWAS